MTTTNVINVRTLIQKVLLTTELLGQISDGQWENAQPFDHWQRICGAEVKVDPTNLGLNFWAKKTNYNFTNSELLDCVGDRMKFAAKIVLYLGLDEAKYDALPNHYFPEDVKNFIMVKSWAMHGDKRYIEQYQEWKSIGINDESIYEIEKVNFSHKMMLNELRDLKKIFKTRAIG